MKKINVLAVALFIVTASAGAALSIGAAAGAQVTTTTSTPSGPVACIFTLPSVPAGQQANLTATGGNGSYVWSSPGLVIANPTGTNFGVTFNAAGTYPVTVTSAGTTSTCNVLVTAVENPAPVTPGLPDTGELPL